LCFGYPSQQQEKHLKPRRPERRFLVQTDHYEVQSPEELKEMFFLKQDELDKDFDLDNFMRAFCKRKYMSAFALEMNRSVGEYLRPFKTSR
jgi:hypothetical protein